MIGYAFNVLSIITMTGRKHHKYRVLCTLSYQIKSWGRPHRFETSLTEPYVLSLQNFSSYQANLPNTGIQIIICFGMYYFVVGKYVCTELAYFLRKVRRRIRNTYLDHCMSIIWVSSIWVVVCVTVRESRNKKLLVIKMFATCLR